MDTICNIIFMSSFILFCKYLISSQVRKNLELIRSTEATNQDYYLFVQGEEFYKQEEYSKAISKFNQAISIKPHQAYYNYRGCALLEVGNYKNAIDDFNKAIELVPNENTYYYNRASAYLFEKCYYEAYNDFVTALNLGSEEAKTELSEIFGVETAWLPNTKRINHSENDSEKTTLKHEQLLTYSNKSKLKINLN